MRTYDVIIFSFLLALVGCSQLIRVEIDDYIKHKTYYKGKRVIITADLENIVERYNLYQGSEVEVTAAIGYFGNRNYRTWYLILERGGKKLRCYEDGCRLYPGRDALFLVKQAKRERGEVTVRGKLMRDGIELNRLSYKKHTINTNTKPPEIRVPTTGFYF